MDPRRLLTPAVAGLLLSGCAGLRGGGGGEAPPLPAPASVLAAAAAAADPPSPVMPVASPTERSYLSVLAQENGPDAKAGPAGEPAPGDAHAPAAGPALPERATPVTGQTAIAAANVEARAASRADAFVGGVQVFAYDPGRVYEVWTAPLRVTTLTLAPGETVTSKAAGDTVRWQIGEASSGEGPGRRTHVLLKPLERGLETNLVLTTSQRVYFLQLRSGGPEAFNAAVAWDIGAVIPPVDEMTPPRSAPATVPAGPIDARYAIVPRGRAPRWTPTAAFNDGVRTFIAFAPDLRVEEAPALFIVAPNGETQMVNYRQQGGMFVVDRLFDLAELRLGDRRPQVVRIRRLGTRGGDRP